MLVFKGTVYSNVYSLGVLGVHPIVTMVNESGLTGAGSADKDEGVRAALALELEQTHTSFPKGNLTIADMKVYEDLPQGNSI